MNQEQIDIILKLGDLTEQLAKTVTQLSDRLDRIENRIEEITPRHQGCSPHQADFVQIMLHVEYKHKDCPIKALFGHEECSTSKAMMSYIKQHEVCKSFLREYISLRFEDYIGAIRSMGKRLDVIEYCLPSDVRRDVNAAMGRQDTFEGVAE